MPLCIVKEERERERKSSVNIVTLDFESKILSIGADTSIEIRGLLRVMEFLDLYDKYCYSSDID